MDSFDREFEQYPSPAVSRRPRHMLGTMIAVSCLLHAISTAILLSPRPSATASPQVSYIDLKEMQFDEPIKPALPEEEQDPVDPVVSEATTIPPESLPQLSEMEQLQKDAEQSRADVAQNPEALQQRSFALGLTSGYFSSIAQGESLRGDIREYYFEMLRQINEKWWLAGNDRLNGRGDFVVDIAIDRNGTILGKRMLRSSGDPAMDRAMIQVLEAANPLPPLPASYTSEVFQAPIKFIKPLNLFMSLNR